MPWWGRDDSAAAAQFAQLRDDIAHLARMIRTMSDQIAADFAAEHAATDNLTTAVQAATAEIKTLADRIATQASAGVVTSDQQAQLVADTQRIQLAADALNAAVAAQTPPAPAPAPEPPPAPAAA